METAVTNREDIYLIDPKKAHNVSLWLEGVADGADSLDSFMEKFPADPVVIEHQKRGTAQSLEELQLHVNVITSKVPLKMYFNAHGLTDHFLMKKVKTLLHSENEEVILKTLKLVLKYKNPIEKPTPIQAKQNNIYFNGKSGGKNNTVSDILSMLNQDNTKVVNGSD